MLIGSGVFLATEEQGTQRVIGRVPEYALGRLAGFFLELSSEKSAAAAGAHYEFFARVSEHDHAGEREQIGVGEVHFRAAGRHAAKPRGLYGGDDPAIPSSARTGKMFDRNTRDLFQPVLGPGDLVMQASVVHIGEIGMSLRVASDLDSERAQAAYLGC